MLLVYSTRKISFPEVGCEHNRRSRRSRVHTKEHCHSRKRRADCRAVLQESAERTENVDFLTAFFNFYARFVNAERNLFNHKDKEEETKNTHNKRCPEHVLTKQVLHVFVGLGIEHYFTDLVGKVGFGVNVIRAFKTGDNARTVVKVVTLNDHRKDHHREHMQLLRKLGEPHP